MILNVGCGKDTIGEIRVDIDITHNPNINIRADCHHLPFRDNTFDVVILFYVLEHAKDPKKTLQEAKRVGKMIHAKFPYKYDRIPSTLITLFTFNPFLIKSAIHDCFWHIATQLKLVDHPIAHRWLVQPTGKIRLNRKNISPWLILHSRTLEKYFGWIPKIMMNTEWECWIDGELTNE